MVLQTLFATKEDQYKPHKRNKKRSHAKDNGKERRDYMWICGQQTKNVKEFLLAHTNQ